MRKSVDVRGGIGEENCRGERCGMGEESCRGDMDE